MLNSITIETSLGIVEIPTTAINKTKLDLNREYQNCQWYRILCKLYDFSIIRYNAYNNLFVEVELQLEVFGNPEYKILNNT